METPRVGPTGETIDTPRHRALGSTSRVAILRLVRAAGAGLTAAEVVEHTGWHLSTVRAHLDRLVEAGLLIKARASGGLPGRPAWRYRAAGPDPAPAPYRSLASALLRDLEARGGDTRVVAARTGERWGQELAAERPAAPPVETALGVLQSLGFDPERQPTSTDDEPVVVHLPTCPFLDLVGRHPDAMCGLHAGVIRGALAQAGGRKSTVTLEPFGAPTACVVRLDLATRGDRR